MVQTTPIRNKTGHFLGDTPTLPIIHALNDTLKTIRSKFSDLDNVVLVVGTSGRTRTGMKYGHFSADSWTSKSATHEIMITGESLERGAEETLGTLLHECAHHLAQVRGIKDTSRQGRFHNAKFKELAEEMGIEVHHDRTIGWSVTTLPKATAVIYRDDLKALRKALKAYRRPDLKPKPPKTTIRLATKSGRKVTVPIKFYEAGDIVDHDTKEKFMPIDLVEEHDGDR